MRNEKFAGYRFFSQFLTLKRNSFSAERDFLLRERAPLLAERDFLLPTFYGWAVADGRQLAISLINLMRTRRISSSSPPSSWIAVSRSSVSDSAK